VLKQHLPAQPQSSSASPLGRSLLPVRSQLIPKAAEGQARSPALNQERRAISGPGHSFAKLALTSSGTALPNGLPNQRPTLWIQPKLTIGAPNDRYEQEADRVAAQVMSMAPSIPPGLQRHAEEDELQTKPLAATITPLVQGKEEKKDPLQAKCEACGEEEQVQRFADGTVQAQPDLESRLNISQGGGSSLPDEVRSRTQPLSQRLK
jgi:hypothetical protein